MTDLQKFLLIGVLLNAALYLVAVFTAGLITNNPVAWKVAIAAFGFASLGYIAQYHQFTASFYDKAMPSLVAGSILLSVIAGFALLVK